MAVLLSEDLAESGDGYALRTSDEVFGNVALGPVRLQIKIIRRLEIQFAVEKIQLGISGEHKIISFLHIIVIICNRIGVGIRVTEAIKLRGIIFHRVCRLVGVVVDVIDRRIDEGLKECIIV